VKSPASTFEPRDCLLDVSRLIWRSWTRRLPTGIDRVCLEYLHRFAGRSQAIVQRRGSYFVLSLEDSDHLFDLLLNPESFSRSALIRFGAGALLRARSRPARVGMFYLNVGHTGLNEASLPAWIASHGLRAVYLVHDLIPLTHPQYCRPGEPEKHRQRMTNVLASATGIIGNSQATLDDLAAFADAQSLSTPSSIAAWISGSPSPPLGHPQTLERSHFITVGTIEGRKNHQLLLDVWRKLISGLGEDAPVLVIVGQRGWQAERIFEQLDHLGELEGHVRELGSCNDQELAGWISGARALLMPSFAEGFGLPVIEALRLGTPVIASDLPVFREIVGDIPAYAGPLETDRWEQLIRAFTVDAPERSRQLTEMKGYRAPDWDKHFLSVDKWLSSL